MNTDIVIKKTSDIETLYQNVVDELIEFASNKSVKSYEIQQFCKEKKEYLVNKIYSITSLNLKIKDISITGRIKIPSSVYDESNFKLYNDDSIPVTQRKYKYINTKKYDYSGDIYVVSFASSISDTISKLHIKLNKCNSNFSSWFSLPTITFSYITINPPNNLQIGDLFVFENFYYTSEDGVSYVDFRFLIIDSDLLEKKMDSLPNIISNSNCFVVTTVMGDVNHPIVEDFRRYRDRVIVKSYLGEKFVTLYYLVGPYISKIIKGNKYLLTISRWIVLKIHKGIIS